MGIVESFANASISRNSNFVLFFVQIEWENFLFKLIMALL